MAKRISIEIDDHNADGICTFYYVVKYKKSGDVGYTQLNPNPISPPIVISGLAEGMEYDVVINRVCCENDGNGNGTSSAGSSTTVNTE